MCREMMMGPNRPGWLCFDCRKQWLKFIAHHPKVQQLIWVEQKFDIWKSRACHPAAATLAEDDGMRLITELREAKSQLDTMADEFCGDE
jgi:hypothetical protein